MGNANSMREIPPSPVTHGLVSSLLSEVVPLLWHN